MRTAAIARPAPWAYGWWLLVGGLLGVGIAGILTIGVFVLPVAIVLAVTGALRPALRNSSAAATLAGLALPVLYIAWLNRGAPGRVCETTGSSTSCSDAWSPWPFVVVALLLVAASIALARVVLRATPPG